MRHDGSNGYIDLEGAGNLDLRYDGYTRMTINSNGYLGLGTTNPTSKLDVRGSSPDDSVTFSTGNSNETHRIVLFGGRQSDPNPFIQWKTGDPLSFATDEGGWSEKLRITSDGRLGIGTSTPSGKLQVAGDKIWVGASGNTEFAAGDGDLYVSNLLELDGNLYQKGAYRYQTGIIEYVYCVSDTLDASGSITVDVPEPLFISGDNMPFKYEVWLSVDFDSELPYTGRGAGYLSGLAWKERGTDVTGYTTISSWYTGSVISVIPATYNSTFTQFTISSTAADKSFKISIRATSGAH